MKSSSRLLIEESPLLFQPSLASAIGLNEAIVIQQVQFWISNPQIGRVEDGCRWVRNSLEDWQKQFPFWSVETIKRANKSLRDLRVLLTRNDLNLHPSDRTGWYSIDYEVLNQYAKSNTGEVNLTLPSDQVAPMVDEVKMTPSYIGESTESQSRILDTAREETKRPQRPHRDASNLNQQSTSRKESTEARSSAAIAPPPVEPLPTSLQHFLVGYPTHRRKYVRSQLLEAWEAAIRRHDPKTIFAALAKQRESWKWMNEPQFIPNIVKWLVEERWNDPIEPAPKQKIEDMNAGGRGILVL